MNEQDLSDVLGKPIFTANARQSMRRRVQIESTVRNGSGLSVSFQVGDLSTGGAFVVKNGVVFDVGAAVEFVLPYRKISRVLELVLPATVVRADSTGMALQFESYNGSTYTELTNLIYITPDVP